MNMIQSSHSGNKDKISADPRTGTINPTMLYFFKIFKVWINRCDLVSPINTLGFLQNPFKYVLLNNLGIDLYKNSPASPVRFINTLPVFLNLPINSVANSRCFILLSLESMEADLGMLNWFFLINWISTSIPLKTNHLAVFSSNSHQILQGPF